MLKKGKGEVLCGTNFVAREMDYVITSRVLLFCGANIKAKNMDLRYVLALQSYSKSASPIHTC